MSQRPVDDEAIQRVLDGRCWEDFCESLKQAGQVILGEGTPENAFDRAEGWRYLSRLTRGALETFLEASDTQAPEFRITVGETIKMGMDNPDNVYLSAPVNGRYEYRISGNRGSVHYLGFGSQAGNYGRTGSLDTTGYLEAKDLQIEPDGSFEIVVSTREQPGNWLPMQPETRLVQIRQTRMDHAGEVLAKVQIERTDGPGQPRPLDPARIDRMLQASASFVTGCATIFAGWARDFEAHVNELPRFDPDRAFAAGGDPNIAYYHSYWKIEPDEALVVEATPPECDYWNFQLANHWLESLDYRYFPIHTNPHLAQAEPDGTIRIVVARENPGVPNWLDTCGHTRGTMCWRWIRAVSHPQPSTRLVKLEDLRRG